MQNNWTHMDGEEEEVVEEEAAAALELNVTLNSVRYLRARY